MMRNIPKCETFLLVVYFVTQATIVQNDTELNRESYFKKIQTAREIVGAA